MAVVQRKETYVNAIIDCKDMSITEFEDDSARTYSISDILQRWDGVPDVSLTIQRVVALPPTGRDEVERQV